MHARLDGWKVVGWGWGSWGRQGSGRGARCCGRERACFSFARQGTHPLTSTDPCSTCSVAAPTNTRLCVCSVCPSFVSVLLTARESRRRGQARKQARRNNTSHLAIQHARRGEPIVVLPERVQGGDRGVLLHSQAMHACVHPHGGGSACRLSVLTALLLCFCLLLFDAMPSMCMHMRTTHQSGKGVAPLDVGWCGCGRFGLLALSCGCCCSLLRFLSPIRPASKLKRKFESTSPEPRNSTGCHEGLPPTALAPVARGSWVQAEPLPWWQATQNHLSRLGAYGPRGGVVSAMYPLEGFHFPSTTQPSGCALWRYWDPTCTRELGDGGC